MSEFDETQFRRLGSWLACSPNIESQCRGCKPLPTEDLPRIRQSTHLIDSAQQPADLRGTLRAKPLN